MIHSPVLFDSEEYEPCQICGCQQFLLFSEEHGIDHAECAKCGAVFYVGDLIHDCDPRI